MKTFSINLPDEIEHQVQELLGTGKYVHKREVFLEAIELLYRKTFSGPDIITPENYTDSTTTDTSAPPPSGELKVTITTRDREPEEDEPTLSSYDRLARVLGVYNGSYNPPV